MTYETRNEIRLPDGRIDCEWNHPAFGWIPFTANAEDEEAHGREIWAQLDAMPNLPVAQSMPGPTPEEALHLERMQMELSFAQMLIGLVSEGWITEEDGRGWLAGTLPPTVIATINLIPSEQQFAATAKAMRPSVVKRLDPLVQMMALAQGRGDEEVDAFFRTYAVA